MTRPGHAPDAGMTVPALGSLGRLGAGRRHPGAGYVLGALEPEDEGRVRQHAREPDGLNPARNGPNVLTGPLGG